MKRSLAAVVGSAVLLAAGVSFAQGAATPAAEAGVATTQPDTKMHMGVEMDEHMKSMRALHDRVKSAGTPEERQTLMREQQAEMGACMAMMNHVAEAGMGAPGSGMMGHHGKPAAGDAQMQMMQKRMDMMQMMMQTMVDQHELTAGAQGAVAAPKP